MTTTPDRVDVIDHYVQESAMQNTDRQMFLLASSVALPWFAALSLAAFKMATVTVATGAAVTVCDPVFVAEMPKAKEGQAVEDRALRQGRWRDARRAVVPSSKKITSKPVICTIIGLLFGL